MIKLSATILLQSLIFLPTESSAKLLLDLPPIFTKDSCKPVNNPFSFSGYLWTVRSGSGGPGPNNWDEQNVCIDEKGWLHLKITEKGGVWSSAEVKTVDSLGFGEYQFWIIGRPDTLDPNVTLGMFNYGLTDCIQEIDMELGRLGGDKPGHYSVYPDTVQSTCPSACSASEGNCQVCAPDQYYCTSGFDYNLSGSYSTHRFTWQPASIHFQSLHGHRDDDSNEFAAWTYAAGNSTDVIPQMPLPVYINYWLFQGQNPTDGKVPQEIIIRRFSYIAL